MSKKPSTVNNDDVVFRRINGRIVPIRRKKGSSPGRSQRRPKRAKKYSKEERVKKFATGSALVAGAGLSGAFGGSVFSEFGDEAKRSREVSKGFQKRAKFIKAQENWLKSKIRIAEKRGVKAGGVFSERTGIGTDDPAFLRKQKRTFTRAGARARLRARNLSKIGFKVGGSALAIGAFAAAAGSRKLYEAATGRDATLPEEAFTDIGSSAAFIAGSNEFGLKQGQSFKGAKKALKKILSKGKL